MLDLSFIIRNLPLFMEGLETTAFLSAAACVGSLIGGGVVAAGTMSKRMPVRAVASAYIEAMRNTPVLIQMFLIYFGLAEIGMTLPAFTSALVALVMQNAAYVGEIYRAGFQSVNRRQYEAALALGLPSSVAIRSLIFPQALRLVIPSLANQLVIILKDTSIASTITVAEVMQIGKLVLERTAAPYEVFITLAAIYLALSAVILGGARLLERALPLRV